MSILTDVAAPAGSIVATGINAISQSRENKKNREWTEAQNNLAYQRQRQLIDEQRAYDTPKAQMMRLMEAGLNPNLIYGGIDQSPMSAKDAPNAAGTYAGVAPQVDPYVAADVALKMAQIRRIENQNENDSLKTSGELKLWAKHEGLTDSQAEFYQSSAKQAMASIDKYAKEIELLDQDVIDKQLENQFKRETFGQRVQAAMDEYGMTHQKAECFVEILDSSIADTWASANLKKKQAWQIGQLTPAERRLKDAMTSFYRNSANKTLTEDHILQLDKAFKEAYGDAKEVADILSKFMNNEMSTIVNILGLSIDNDVRDTYKSRKK